MADKMTDEVIDLRNFLGRALTDYALANIKHGQTGENAVECDEAEVVLLAHIAARLGGGEAPVAWADVPGFEGLYRISSEGDLFSTRAGKVLAKNLAGAGYMKADLHSEGKRVQTYIHKLVADAFLPPSDLPEVNHINGIKTDNRASNLEWTTRSGNVNHNYYVLGYRVRPVIAHKISTGEERLYPSIEAAVADGFTSAHIYRSINNQSRTHKGFKFSYSETTPPARLAATPEETEQSIKADAYDMCAEALAKAGLLTPGGSVVDAVRGLAATAVGVTEEMVEAAVSRLFGNAPDVNNEHTRLTVRAALEAALANQTKKD